ncbi:TonB-dependent receptor [Owenweeksia hongkongensis]|uniref:Outer membrane receptor protein n=1 Tax=Owenweeksia hongkongensis (strain DSM 17368 / CIP 108786 / JCM 12287 / NRRL B-23963 / UST20020801) TaxID=926562 RepID=G8QZT2_OWEHD|nr:TonB-dependent receptor [Owenweeksia hongkongensis]AEV31526.1 outer membrane receptor protein [Owenweeksia hongkongensis DSM 17368]
MRLPLFALCFFSSISFVFAQHNLEVALRDNETREAIPYAMMEIHESGQRINTDVFGTSLVKLTKGSYHLHFSATGFEASDLDITLKRDTSFTVFLKPTFVELREVLIEEGISKTTNRKLTQDIERINISENSKTDGATLAEALSNVAGVASYNTGVGIAKPIIRGFTATRISVYDQGIKQEGQQWGMDHGLEIDPFSANRMEILKGAGALQYGSDALGGVVKLLPDPVPDNGFSGGYTGMYKSNNGTIGNSVHLNIKKDKHFVSGRISYQDYDDYRIPADEFTYNGFVLPVVDNRLKNTAGNLLSGRLTYGYLGEKYNLRLMASQYKQNVGLYPGATGIPRAYDVANIGDVSDIDLPNQEVIHSKLYAKLNVKIKDNWLITDVGFQQNDRVENSNPHSHGFIEIDEDDTEALGLDLKTLSLNSSYSWSKKKIKYVLGTNQQYQKNVRSGWEYLLPDFETYNGGIFTLLNGDFSEKLSWSGGVRLDYGYVNSKQYLQPWYNDLDSLVERSPDLDRHFFNYAASAGVSYFPNDTWNFKVNLAKSFRVPVPAELASNGVHHGTFRHEIGSSDLDAEEGYQLDLTAIFQKKAFYIKLTPFLNCFTNYLYLRPSGMFSPLPDAGQMYIYSQTQALHTGGELFAEVHPIEHLHISTALEYVFNLNLETNLPLPFTPPLSNLFSVEYDLIKNSKVKWTIVGEYRATSAQNRVDRNEKITPGYNLFNAKTTLQFPVWKTDWVLGLSCRNIGNTAYLSHLSRYRILNLPEQGRNIILSLNVGF